jgi:signal transduction histidine kinase
MAVAEMLGTALANARQFEREQESVRRLQELDRLKHEFLGTVSHELQTPITAIMGFSSILNEQFDDVPAEQRRDYLARVVRNAESLSALVHQLLDFSRLGRRSFDLHTEEIDLSTLAEQIVHQFATLIERHRLDVVVAPGVWALADPDAVERILTNLLSNAAKYSPPGSLITLTVEPDEHGARMVVDDAGPGIAEVDRPHVFDRFYRGSSPAAVATRGAGIGLAVVKDLVDRMHGTVSVDTAPTGGARFTVVLPAEPDDTPHPPPPAAAEQGRLT